MDGITPYQARKLVGVTYRVAKKYFTVWAEELVDDENYETWVQKQKRIRARKLEGTAKQIISVKQRLHYLEIFYANIILAEKKTGKGKNEFVTKNIKDIDHKLQYMYELQIRNNVTLLEKLKVEAFAIQMLPPADVILDRELEKEIAQKQSIN